MGGTGFEPVTSSVSRKRSTPEPTARTWGTGLLYSESEPASTVSVGTGQGVDFVGACLVVIPANRPAVVGQPDRW